MRFLWFLCGLTVSVELKFGKKDVLAPSADGSLQPTPRPEIQTSFIEQETRIVHEVTTAARLKGTVAKGVKQVTDELKSIAEEVDWHGPHNLKKLMVWGAFITLAVVGYAYVARLFRNQKMRKDAMTVQFLRPEVPARKPLFELDATERLAQETQVVIAMEHGEFVVRSVNKDELLVGKAQPSHDKRQGCLLAQCLSAVCGFFFCGIAKIIASATEMLGLNLPLQQRKSNYATRWMVGAGRGPQHEPTFSFKHEDATPTDQIVVRDVGQTRPRGPVGRIDIDPCSWQATIIASKTELPSLSIDGSTAASPEAFLRVTRGKDIVALITRGVHYKGFAPGVKLNKNNVYVDFGSVTDPEEKLLLVAAAVYSD